MKKLLLGNEAIARGAYEAGVKVSAAYPGTPSTEISEAVAKYDEIYAEWSPNEKVATEVAIGASVGGVRSMCAMKHVGANVAADPLYTSSYTGVNGGMVMVVADDPGMYSSQNEQDTRMIGRAAMVPVLEPSDSQDAKDYMIAGFEISEKYDTPVILRTTTRLSHSQGLVELNDRIERETIPYERKWNKFVVVPGNMKPRHIVVEKNLKRLSEDASSMSVNNVEYKDTSLGFITCGIAYQYVKEVCPDASVLKLGLVNPLPTSLIKEFCQKVDRVIVFEELEPVIEEQVRALGYKVEGKELFTRQGEYSSNMLRKALGIDIEMSDTFETPGRPPILCPGCPHRSVYTAMKQLKLHAFGDIGCYTLGANAPLSVIDTCFCMGSSISGLHGLEKACGHEFIENWVAVIGDSTFMHTGINSLINMVYNQSHATVVILDNSTTGMTGHQDHAATGKTLKGQIVPAINIMYLCKSLGIENVYEVNSYDLAAVKELLKRETKRDALSVIITKSPCVLLKEVSFPDVCVTENDKCKKCGACMTPGCPALSKNEDGTIRIDNDMCNGCGLCVQLCKFDAIKKIVR